MANEVNTQFTAPKMTIGLISLLLVGLGAWTTARTDAATQTQKVAQLEKTVSRMQTSVSSIDVINANQLHISNTLVEIKRRLIHIDSRLEKMSLRKGQ